MRVAQVQAPHFDSAAVFAPIQAIQPQMALVFGAVDPLSRPELLAQLKAQLPGTILAGCSTAGEITADGVSDDTVVVTGIHFDHPALRFASAPLRGMESSYGAGQALGQQLRGEGLHHILVFGQGVEINGSALIDGIRDDAGVGVTICGGLAGDGGAFWRTLTFSELGAAADQVVAIGFYDPRTRITHGSFGGWQPFGPTRRVTKVSHNVLYELDGQPALDVYKRYLGEYAKQLPSSGLLFPFAIVDGPAAGLIRTILGVDEADGSLTLAGDVPLDGSLQLMHASTDSLIDGAHTAATRAQEAGADPSGLALLVSCVGRKLVMGARVDEEVEAVAEVLARDRVIAGFYSYGEISPLLSSTNCQLHNQTMTVTHIQEG